ncbi:hypothetical protein AAKU52_002448 [Pedobacter sp. CG_S7]|uniref:hypothetical protein n=1 Tax=Pedobacter sp. CG_S7 TaxID=3143930 RepID=UPI003396D7AE
MLDFIQIASDGSHTIGKAKIVEDWKSMFFQSSPVFECLPNEIIFNRSGYDAWEQSTWSFKEEAFHKNYTTMWRKIKGQWFTQCELYVKLH